MRLTHSAFVLPLLLGTLAPAQAANGRPIERQVEFIRALARDLGFVALAQEETDRLLKDKKAADEFKQVAQLGIEISLYGAKAIRNDRERQRTLFKDALDRSKEFIERYRGDAAALPAQITLTEACYEYGRFLADEVEIARSDAPEKVHELEEAAASVFQLGKDTCDEVMAGLASAAKSDADAHLKRGVAWLRKGILLREHARAVKKDRDYLASTSRSTLTDLALEYGEETILGMRAMFECSQVDEVIGKLDAAASAYRDTVDAIFESLNEQELPVAARTLLGSMMQEGYDRLTTTLLELGKPDDVFAAVTEFDERLKKLEAEEDTRYGHAVRLNYARALAETGEKEKVAQGLEIAAKINDQHPADVVGLKAKNILRDILSMQSSLVSGELLYQIALGDLQSRRYEEAVQGFKRAIAAMTPAEASKLGMLAHLNLGRAFGAQTRPLEAVYALIAGLTKYKDSDEGAASDAGRLLEVAMRQVRFLSKNDTAFESLNTEAVRIAASVGGVQSQDKVNWQTASDKMAQKKFADAAGAYALVTADSPYYELALVRQVQAWKAAKEPDKALAAADAYRKWRDAAGQATSTNRELAEAELEFNLGDLAYMQATGDIGAKAEPAKFQDVVARFSDYPKRFGSVAPNLSQYAYDLLARAHVELGQRDKAEEAYRSLSKMAPDSSLVPKLSTAIFVSHYENVKHLSDELDGVYKNNADDKDAIKQVKAKLSAARKATVAFGRDYARSAAKPQYEILYIALQNADELRDWTGAQDLANKIVEDYGRDEKYKSKVDQYVRPVLGKILLRQQKVRQAYDMLVAAEKELDAGGVMRAAAFPVKQLICQCLGGWHEVDERGDVVPYPGLGRPAEAYDKQWTEVRPYALSSQRGVTDYSLPWYEFHWEAYLYASLAGVKESKYKEYAAKLYRIASSTDNFDALRKLGPRGEELAQLFVTLQRSTR
ncbi:MAG: hypothetical protein R3F56_02385 [Planctomycetota bacterium]